MHYRNQCATANPLPTVNPNLNQIWNVEVQLILYKREIKTCTTPDLHSTPIKTVSYNVLDVAYITITLDIWVSETFFLDPLILEEIMPLIST